MLKMTTQKETQEILRQISRVGRITAEMKRNYFKGCGFKEIRDWLEGQGLDRHMTIQLDSTEVAIKTPQGLLMQVRRSDNDRLGFWGGVIEDGESPLEGAVRELIEETGLTVSKEDLKFVGIDNHEHRYTNWDSAQFHAYRYELELNYAPKILETNEIDTNGIFYLSNIQEERFQTVLEHQRQWAISLLEDTTHEVK